MEAEADALRADGIVGVRLDVEMKEFGADIAEFIAVGTAVKAEEGAGGGGVDNWRNNKNQPFTSDLSGQDFWTLIRAGYAPLGMVMGTCVYHIAHQKFGSKLGNIGKNVEIEQFTQALYDARELAMSRMQAEAENCTPRVSSRPAQAAQPHLGLAHHRVFRYRHGRAAAAPGPHHRASHHGPDPGRLGLAGRSADRLQQARHPFPQAPDAWPPVTLIAGTSGFQPRPTPLARPNSPSSEPSGRSRSPTAELIRCCAAPNDIGSNPVLIAIVSWARESSSGSPWSSAKIVAPVCRASWTRSSRGTGAVDGDTTNSVSPRRAASSRSIPTRRCAGAPADPPADQRRHQLRNPGQAAFLVQVRSQVPRLLVGRADEESPPGDRVDRRSPCAKARVRSSHPVGARSARSVVT